MDEHVGGASVSIPPEKHKGFAPVLLKYRDRITSLFTTTEDGGTVATKTKKALDPQRKPRLFDSRGDWTPIELFGEVVEAWEDHLHAFLVAA